VDKGIKNATDEVLELGFKSLDDYASAKRLFGSNKDELRIFSSVVETSQFEKTTTTSLTIKVKNGGFETAVNDWKRFGYKAVLKDSPDIKIGELSNGSIVIARVDSSDKLGRPTLEFQRLTAGGKKRPEIKIRYNP
jgi:hypothetical protein